MIGTIATRDLHDRDPGAVSSPGPRVFPQTPRLAGALQRDPFQPHLRLHPLSGELQGRYAVRLTVAYRVPLTLEVTEQAIVLLDIGGHDEGYR